MKPLSVYIRSPPARHSTDRTGQTVDTPQENMHWHNYSVAAIQSHKNSRLTGGGDSLQMASPYEATTQSDRVEI